MEKLNPSEEGQLNPEEGQEGEQGTAVKETPASQAEEKLYAGRFKTPEELEEAYKFSGTEGIRLAQENKRLQAQLRQVPQKQEAPETTDLSKHFEPETAGIIQKYVDDKVQTKLNEFHQTSRQQGNFQTQVAEVWEKTKELFPEAANPQSKLYLRANEILFERGFAKLGDDGTVELLTPFAYRSSVEAAAAELGRQASEAKPNQTKKNQAGAIQGKGSKSVVQGKLSYEQYMNLSDDQKDAYDAQK